MRSVKDDEPLVSLPSSGEEESEGEAELTSGESESDWSCFVPVCTSLIVVYCMSWIVNTFDVHVCCQINIGLTVLTH